MPAQVFISYSSKDRTIANMVCALLEERGHPCWIAPRDIVPGREWGEAIVDGIRTTNVFVLIFSQHANQSPQILREVERAVNKGMPIIPFRIEDVVPQGSLEYFMSVPHWLDALAPPVEDHIARLGDVIDQLARGDSELAGDGPVNRRGAASRWRHPVVRAGLGGGLLALLVAAAVLADLAPPGGALGWLSVLVALVLPPALAAARIGIAWHKPALRYALIALGGFSVALYLWASSSYIVEGSSGSRLVRGTNCTPDAALIYESECPDLPADALADAAFEPAMLWTKASIARAEQMIGGGWLAAVLAAALLLGSWSVPRQIIVKQER